MKLEEYFQPREFTVDNLWFDLDGFRHRGHGIMEWDPSEGFHIRAFIDRGHKPRVISIRDRPLVESSDLTNIHLQIREYDWAIAPNTFIPDRFSLQIGQFLSVIVSSIIICENSLSSGNSDFWNGSALFLTSGRVLLPDTFVSHTVAGTEPILYQTQSGIRHQDENSLDVIGRFIDPDGGLSAKAEHESIFTRANDMESLKEMARDAVQYHFPDEHKRPKRIFFKINYEDQVEV